jgi:AbiV family abortive infection protein
LSKRPYRSNLEFVERGIRACSSNAVSLATSSKKLLDVGDHAHALALAVLSVEEFGKVCAVDALLFAKQGDDKSATFARSMRDHRTKLGYFATFPFLIGNLARADLRAKQDQAFAETIAFSTRRMQAAGNDVLSKLGSDGFSALDLWKQKSLYVTVDGGTFVDPSEVIKPELAAAVCHLASFAADLFSFVSTDENLSRYFEMARAVRARLTESAHQQLELAAEGLVEELFSGWPDQEAGESLH